MFAQNNKISVRQLECMLLLYFFGTAVLFLPAELAGVSGNACWLVAIFWGLIATLTTMLLCALGRRNPSFSAVDWYCDAFGQGLGKVLGLGLGAKLIFDGALELRIFSEIISSAMLPKTPLWLIMAAILFLAWMGARGGAESGARGAELLFFLVCIPLAVVLIAVAITGNYGRVLPLALPVPKEIWQSSTFFGPVFQGLSILLFAFPFLQKPEKVGSRLGVITLIATLVFSVIVFLSLATYGEAVLQERLLPTLQMMERVSFTGIFLSRQDLLLLWIWMASCFLFLTAVLVFSGVVWQKVWQPRGKKTQEWLILSLVLLFLLGLAPRDMATAYWLRLEVAPWLNGIFLVLLPSFLLLKTRGRKGGAFDA